MTLQQYTYNRITYYVDYRLQQFRSNTPKIRFYDFRSHEGDRILCSMLKKGLAKTELLNL